VRTHMPYWSMFATELLDSFPRIVAKVDGHIFQEDGAPAHFGAIVRTSLDKRFPGSAGQGRLIGLHGVLI
jgi:hypothetical protein